jgi:DNA-binding response OmpR family regulator
MLDQNMGEQLVRKVLLVEPLWSLGKLFEWHLKQRGCSVTSYQNIDAAIYALPGIQGDDIPDIVIIDCFPTVEAGYKFMQTICQISAFTDTLLIGLVGVKGENKVQHKNYVEFEKPFNLETVIRAIDSYLKGERNG